MSVLITPEAVARAAVEIQAAGERVTVERIRARTGGSNSTILPLLRQWRDGTLRPTIIVDTAGPDGPPAAVAKAIATLATAMTTALAEARAEERRTRQAECNTLRAELVTIRQQADIALAAEQTTAADLAAEADDLRAVIENHLKSLGDQENESRRLAAALVVAEAERNQLATQLMAIMEENLGLAATAARITEQLAAARAEIDRLSATSSPAMAAQ